MSAPATARLAPTRRATTTLGNRKLCTVTWAGEPSHTNSDDSAVSGSTVDEAPTVMLHTLAASTASRPTTIVSNVARAASDAAGTRIAVGAATAINQAGYNIGVASATICL